jgi:polysaccharide pyruvyl transferase WcaK-like protein
LGRLVLSIALECLAILNASKTVQDMDYFIVSGGGQLDDYWGGPSHHPYTMLVWSLIAKLRKARLRFVSVGAGPIDHKLSRWFIKVALCLADYRSYRDEDSKRLIEKIGFKRNDPVYPDLAHSLDIERYCGPQSSNRTRLLVGIGPMAYFDPRVWPERDLQVYMSYLVKLALFIVWLLQNGHDILLFTSEVGQDPKVTADLRELLTEHGVCTTGAESRVIEQPIETVDDLMSQLAITDLVVASRFHGVLLAQLLSKPVLALSYHKKIDVLMADMGQAEYCLPINCFDLDTLKERFISMEANRQAIKAQMAARTKEYREALDEQYQYLFRSE